MKGWRIVIVLFLCLVLAGSTACNSFGRSTTGTEQLIKVERGDLSVTVSGSGNIKVTNERELTFVTGGKVDQIYVEEGDSVSEGEKLASLETDSLEVALTQAQVNYTQAQLTLQTAEYDLEQAQDVYSTADITAARAAVREASSYVAYAQSQLDKAVTTWDVTVWTNEVAYAKEQLRILEARLDDMLSAPDTEEVALKRLKVEVAGQSLELAEQSLARAQKQLDEATITAPFAGVVAKVNVDEKDTISATTVIIHLIDPSTMELVVEVDEIDVPSVEVGQKAIIDVDALPNVNLEGKVISISLLSNEKSGVIVYNVKINFDVVDNLGLRDGMSANADIVIAERTDVLIVPNRVLKQDSDGNTVVRVLVGETVEERQVVVGISDGLDSEIISGLSEGETVVGE